MRIAFAADHAGWPLRETILRLLAEANHDILDCGPPERVEGDDYPDGALAVARAIAEGCADRGILACGSGVGASVAANKVAGVRACLCHDTFSAHQGVEDDDMNVLCLGARIVGESLAQELVRAYLAARFSGAERHVRRLAKISAAERDS